MENLSNNKQLSQNEYWNYIISTLSSYEEKIVLSDGKVRKNMIYDDYFLANDIWNLEDIERITNFKEQYINNKNVNHKIDFTTENRPITQELKFIFFYKIFKDEWKLSTMFNTSKSMLYKLKEFLNEKFPHLDSLLNLEIKKAEKEWIWWLTNKGVKTIITRNKTQEEYENKTQIANFLTQMYDELFILTDTREEWEKDRWDVRELNQKFGVDYVDSISHYFLDFTKIENNIFKQNFKKYIKARLIGGKNFSWASDRNYLKFVPKFLNFITKIEPEWMDLKHLGRSHIESYIKFIHQYTKNSLNNKNKNPKSYIRYNIQTTYTFLRDIQRYEYDIAPIKNTNKFLYLEDCPKRNKKSVDEIDYIPDYVLEQLFENINDLHPDLQAVVWISFKTGLRISDTLGLTQDCLVKLNGKYSVVTDIEKTYVKGHRIPIDDKLANIIGVLIDKSKQSSNEDNNPKNLIFVRYRGSRKGKPFSRAWVQDNLNQLAKNKNIKDENGRIFHFKTHQFRHTYAVKMLNGGADILTVQELLAHASPEMTMRYARLLDDTKRKAFEKVVKQGVFSFDLNGEMHQVNESEEVSEDIMDMLWQNEKLNALDNPYGSCRARINGNCPLAAEPPCLTANDGKPCFDLAVGISDMDVKKYELHIESTMKMIEAAKQFGREDMVKANEKNLERYQGIYDTIKSGNVIFGRFDRIKKDLDKKRKDAKRG